MKGNMEMRYEDQLRRQAAGDHPTTPEAAADGAVKATVALSYVPAILFKLDGDTIEMFAAVMQAMRDGGYADGHADGVRFGKKGGVS